MKNLLSALLLVCLMTTQVVAYGEDMVVIANPKSGIDRLSKGEVINIFLGRLRQLSSGITAQPVDLPPAHPDKARFYLVLVNKDLAEINAYWSRLVFSGRTSPPRAARSEDELLNFIRHTPGAIGYVNRSRLDDRVKLVYELGSQRIAEPRK